MGSVAIVNGKKISKTIFDIKLEDFLKNYDMEEKQYTKSEYYEIKSLVIDKLIDEELMIQYAKENKIYAELHEVKKRFNELTANYTSEDEFQSSLNELGVTVEQIFEDIKNDIVIRKVMQKQLNPYIEKIDEQMLREFYDFNKQNFEKGPAVKARHIFVKVNDFSDMEEAKKCKSKIQHIFEKLKSGADFVKTATDFSDCNSAEYGGDLGIFTYDEIDNEFADIIFKIPPGTISNPFATDAGFHIAYLEKYFESYTPSFDKVRAKLKDYVKDLVEYDALEEFLEQLWQDADIVINEY